ncbi:MAG: hypothetical protein WC827_00550 [Candidatus Paceibacterota bacterium]|jgi:hypothetical protein
MSKEQYFLSIEPSLGLKEKIIFNIEKEAKKKAFFAFVFGGLTSLTSVLAMVYSLILIIKDYYVSGLSEYMSLIFSDSSVLMGLWKEYTYSIIESLPFVTITLTLVSLWIFVWSIKYIFSNLKTSSFIS